MRRFLSEIYSGKTVLLTGHTGFKGSWLSTWLRELGAAVVGYALAPYTDKDNFVKAGLTGKIADIRGDVRDFAHLQDVFKKYSPEIVFHLAAQPLVRESYAHPKETYDVNVGGSVNVLENCRLFPSVKVIVNVTSDKCYENKEWIWGYRENDSLGGQDPYSSSKACSELITSAYRRSFFAPQRFADHGKALSSVRAGNVIGGGDWQQDRIIPDCIRALEGGQKIVLRSPEAVRPWQFVLEPLGGYLLLAAKMLADPVKYSGAWNFGPESSSVIPVRDLAELVGRYWGGGSWEKWSGEGGGHEARLLALDISKARHNLGWKPLLTVAEAVEQTVQWYQSYCRDTDMYDFCKDQIFNYMNRM